MKTLVIPSRRFVLAISFLLTSLGIVSAVSGDPGSLVRYQGQAVDAKNVPLEGPYTLTFRLYDKETAGKKTWEETQKDVPIKSGSFSVLLGQVTSLATVDWSTPLWLSVQVGTEPELAPRQRLTSVPMAIRAEQLAGPLHTVGNNVGIGMTNPVSQLDIAATNQRPFHSMGSGSFDWTGVVDRYGTSGGGGFLVRTGSLNTHSSVFQVEANHPELGGGGTTRIFVVTDDGNVGIGMMSPQYPLQMGSGAYVSPGGVWTNASSRTYKQDIAPLTMEAAVNTLAGLDPVTFRYKADPNESHVGFIAEDVPALVATKDRQGLSPMDIVAVLTKVVKQQQAEIEELKRRLDDSQNE